MTLILSGTDGVSDVDGSAATPAVRGADANTGIFFPAADTIGFSEGGVEVARITNTSAWSFGASGTATGTSGQVLTSAGSGAAPAWATPSASPWVVLASGTVSDNPTAIDVETGFTDASNVLILIYYQNITCSGSGNPSFRFRIGGAYNSSSVYTARNMDVATSVSVNTATSQPQMVLSALPQITSAGTSFAIVVQNRFQGASTGAAFITNPWWGHQNNGTAAGTSYGFIAGTSGDVQGLRFFMTGGGGATQFTGGTFVAYGIKSS